MRRLALAAKIVLAVALLAWVFSEVHWRDYTPPGESSPRTGVVSSLRTLHPGWMAVAVGLCLVSVAPAAVRWKMLLGTQGVNLDLRTVFRVTLLGEFVSTVTPGSVGGDAVKMYSVMKTTPHKGAVLVSTLADRLIGLGSLLALAAAMLVVTLGAGMIDRRSAVVAAVSIAVAAGGIVAALGILLSGRLRHALGIRRLLRWAPLQKCVTGGGRAVGVLRARPRVLLGAAALSALSQALQVTAVLSIGVGLRLPIDAYRYFVCVPVIFMAGAVPLTPGGLGVVEQLFITYLGAAASPSGVLALALLARLAWMICVLPGALVMVMGAKLPPAEKIRAELDLAEAQSP